MNNKSLVILSSLILAIGTITLGALLRSGIVGFKDSERTVAVKGLSERTVEADNVIWPIQYKIIGNDLPALYSTIEQNNLKITRFLEKNGISKDDISTPLPIVIDLLADRYSNQSDIRSRYNVTATVTVTSKNVAQVRKAMANVMDLIKEGLAVNSEQYGTSQVVFSYNSLNEIKPEMIEEATKSARESAEKFALDSQSELGKIKFASQGQFTISDPDLNAPHIKLVRVVTTIQYYLQD